MKLLISFDSGKLAATYPILLACKIYSMAVPSLMVEWPCNLGFSPWSTITSGAGLGAIIGCLPWKDQLTREAVRPQPYEKITF